MPFVRDPVPSISDARIARAYFERTLQNLDDWASQIEDRVNQLVRLRQIDGLEVRYFWDDSSIDIGVPVAATFIKVNSALPENATEVATSRFDAFNRLALDAQLADFIAVGFFEIRNFTRDTFYLYSVDAQPAQRDIDITFPVTIIESDPGAPPQQDDVVQAQWWSGTLLAPTKNI